MRIVAVKIFPLFYPLAQPYGDANGYKLYRASFLVCLTTQGGINGWGEVTGWLPGLKIEFEQHIIPYLLGKSALERNQLLSHIKRWQQRAAAGISMALTEIAAVGAGMSVCELWGGRRRDKVPVYASFQSYTDQPDWKEHSLSLVEQALDEGFNTVKVKIGAKTFGEDLQHIKSIHQCMSSQQQLIVDANQSYDLATALKWGQQMAAYENLAWLEEPLPIAQLEDYKLLRSQALVPIAGGENLTQAAEFLPFLQGGGLDIIQPDPAHLAGLDQYRHTLKLARTYGVRVSPHSFDGALSRLYALFAQACLPPWSKMAGQDIEPVEWDVMENPFTALVPLKPIAGEIHIPPGIGIGLELDGGFIQKYQWNGSTY